MKNETIATAPATGRFCNLSFTRILTDPRAAGLSRENDTSPAVFPGLHYPEKLEPPRALQARWAKERTTEQALVNWRRGHDSSENPRLHSNIAGEHMAPASPDRQPAGELVGRSLYLLRPEGPRSALRPDDQSAVDHRLRPPRGTRLREYYFHIHSKEIMLLSVPKVGECPLDRNTAARPHGNDFSLRLRPHRRGAHHHRVSHLHPGGHHCRRFRWRVVVCLA